MRVNEYVRFSHGWSPLSDQWYRQIRQLFSRASLSQPDIEGDGRS